MLAIFLIAIMFLALAFAAADEQAKFKPCDLHKWEDKDGLVCSKCGARPTSG
jgi:hypothetical protein